MRLTLLFAGTAFRGMPTVCEFLCGMAALLPPLENSQAKVTRKNGTAKNSKGNVCQAGKLRKICGHVAMSWYSLTPNLLPKNHKHLAPTCNT